MRVSKFKKEHIVTSVVAVIVNEREEVLLTRRSVAPFLGEWVMPGGKIDLGEPAIQALKREVQEEVGIEVEVDTIVDIFEHLTPGEKTAISSSSTTGAVRCTKRSTTIPTRSRTSGGCRETSW